MNKTVNVKNITLISMGIALNVVGAFIALNLRLPIYLDSIGTILIACMLGPKYAVITGVGGSLVSGMTFDIYSLYFAPVQITTGYLAGIMYKKDFNKWSDLFFWNKWKIRNKREREKSEKDGQQPTDSIITK